MDEGEESESKEQEMEPGTGGSSIMQGKDGKKRKGLIKKLGTGIKDFDYRFKVVVIGTSGTGKTSLLLRFSDAKYNDDHLVTIGVDFKTKAL